MNTVKVKMPEKGSVIVFKNYIKTQWFPFVIYGDFESFVKPIDTVSPNPNMSYTTKYQSHEPSGYCFCVMSFDEDVFKSRLEQYTGEDTSTKFVEAIERVAKGIYDLPEKEMIFTKQDQKLFNEATECHICGEGFDEKEEDKKQDKGEKVRDHCHYTGKYRGGRS